MGDYQQYHYEMFDLDPDRPLKIISQPLYDHAAEHGFPPDFFTNSYFDHVDFGHIPEGVDCSGCGDALHLRVPGPLLPGGQGSPGGASRPHPAHDGRVLQRVPAG